MSEQGEILSIESIDFSSVAQPRADGIASDWDPPPHKFFGKRLPNGKSEQEPQYVYQEYPRMLYGRDGDKIRAKVVHDDESRDALLAEGYALTPAEFGVVTCPSFEDATRMRIERERNGEDFTTQTETVEVVKRKPGRPRKAG